MGAGSRIGVIGSAAALLLGYALPATASEFGYDLSVYNTSAFWGSVASGTDSAPIGGVTTAVYPPPGTPPPYSATGTTTMSAFAERGRVRARAQVSAALEPPYNSFVYGGRGTAEIVIDDLVASGPPGLASASLNVDVVGTLSGDYTSPHGTVFLRLESLTPLGTIRGTTNTSVVLGAASLTTSAVDFMAGDTFRVTLRLQAGPRLLFNAPGSKSADVDFESLGPVEYGAHFPVAGPVLNLPPGYTVDSADANVVDNHWLGAGDAPAVPALGPLATGLLAIALLTSARFGAGRVSSRF